MRLGQFGVLLAQAGEQFDGFLVRLSLARMTTLRKRARELLGFAREVCVQRGQSGGVVALLMQLRRLRVAVGFGRAAAGEPAQHRGRSRTADEGASSCYTFSQNSMLGSCKPGNFTNKASRSTIAPCGSVRAPAGGGLRAAPTRAVRPALMLRIHNSLTRQKQDFVPIEPGKVRMYVCGMTVYDYCHIGHARVMVVFDVDHADGCARAASMSTYVRNITDIDDKIIKRAPRTARASDLTERFIRLHGRGCGGARASRSRTSSRAPRSTSPACCASSAR